MGRIQEILETKQFPGVHNTRDVFGIKNAFYDYKTKKYITNRSEWEKAGYRDPLEVTKNSNVKAQVKRKMEKIRKYDSNKRTSVMMG